MSFPVVLLSNKSERIRVDKDLTEILNVSCTLKQNTNIKTPVFIIKADFEDIIKSNYLYVPSFTRYYYIDNIMSVNGGLFEISCSVDVLMSFKDTIRENRGIIERQETQNNLFFNDGSFNCYQNPHIITKSFPSGFNPSAQNYILTVAGGITES